MTPDTTQVGGAGLSANVIHCIGVLAIAAVAGATAWLVKRFKRRA